METFLRLEVHYYLRDEWHSMDALVRNRCEAEFLAAIGYIAQALGAELRFEATAPTEGGFRDIWKVFDKDNRPLTVPTLVTLLGILVTIWNAPAKPDKELEKQQLEINRLTIEHWKLENERSALEVGKLKHEMQGLPPPAKSPAEPPPSGAAPIVSTVQAPPAGGTTTRQAPQGLSLQTDPRVNKRRSNFYKQLLPYDRVTAVGFRWHPADAPLPEERIVLREAFPSFVMHTDKLEPEITEAVIEIVSPVITEGDMQWKGRWNGQTIAFAMDDKAFKDQVLHKQVRFQHGDSIRCVIESERKLDEGGCPKVTGHRVRTVLDKIESSGQVYETAQGRKKRFEDKYTGEQPGLFSEEDV